ncbi:hypothetical protein FLM52_14605 [bacterium Scap17]|nr:hypothetical protein [bacterium Scap17]
MRIITQELVARGAGGNLYDLGKALNLVIEAEHYTIREVVDQYQHLGLTRELAVKACNEARSRKKRFEARRALRHSYLERDAEITAFSNHPPF